MWSNRITIARLQFVQRKALRQYRIHQMMALLYSNEIHHQSTDSIPSQLERGQQTTFFSFKGKGLHRFSYLISELSSVAWDQWATKMDSKRLTILGLLLRSTKKFNIEIVMKKTNDSNTFQTKQVQQAQQRARR